MSVHHLAAVFRVSHLLISAAPPLQAKHKDKATPSRPRNTPVHFKKQISSTHSVQTVVSKKAFITKMQTGGFTVKDAFQEHMLI